MERERLERTVVTVREKGPDGVGVRWWQDVDEVTIFVARDAPPIHLSPERARFVANALLDYLTGQRRATE